MNIITTPIEGLCIIEPSIFGDSRGYFFESYNKKALQGTPLADINFVQDNESRSRYGVLRGLHFQLPPYAQSKLVRVVVGEVMDVAVDLRKGSATYGEYFSVRLSADNHRQFFIPRGFAHGFVVLSEDAIFQYKCDNYYAPSHEGAIAWNDATLAIDWLIPEADIILSEKDRKHPTFETFVSPF